MTQPDRTPAGVRSFREVTAAKAPAGAGPAITTITITAMSVAWI